MRGVVVDMVFLIVLMIAAMIGLAACVYRMLMITEEEEDER